MRPPAILHALAAYGEQLWRAALSQPSPTALPQVAAGLLGRPEAGLGHSGPAQRAGNHLSPVAEVGLLRPPRRRQRAARGQASRAPCATGGAIWGTAAWGQLIGTLSTAGGHGAGSYKDLGMVHVAPGSRSPFWSQNQVKVLIDRESSFCISSTKTPRQIFFSNSTRFVHQVSMLLRFQDLNPTSDP